MHKTPNPEYYYNELSGATLEVIERTPRTQIFMLRKYPNSTMMSAILIFTPFGITITGDLHVSGKGGITAPGYGLLWFTQRLEADYLAGKFLRPGWVPELAHAYFASIRNEFIERREDYRREREALRAHLQQEATETGEPFDPAEDCPEEEPDEEELKPRTWRVGNEELTNATIIEALDFLLAEDNEDLFNNPQTIYDAMPVYRKADKPWVVAGMTFSTAQWAIPFCLTEPGGYDYDPAEVGWLSAIQRHFAEEYIKLPAPEPDPLEELARLRQEKGIGYQIDSYPIYDGRPAFMFGPEGRHAFGCSVFGGAIAYPTPACRKLFSGETIREAARQAAAWVREQPIAEQEDK